MIDPIINNTFFNIIAINIIAISKTLSALQRSVSLSLSPSLPPSLSLSSFSLKHFW